MERDILFRGKRKDDGEWIEGYYAVVNPMDMPSRFRKPKAVIFLPNTECNWFYKYFFRVVEVLPETVGEFTGLTDINGRKIFEGDILAYRLEDSENETIDGVVKYGEFNCGCCDGVYGWYIEGGDIRALDMNYGFDDDERLYIIGNIHDNPELMEGKHASS